ncbi:MAG: hypothetical protein IKM59_02285 [Oscillospiraceae bacterium]|nr:hypothetical protein [Oscillospiraceae bacterium]
MAGSKKDPIQLSDHFTYKRLLRFTLPSMGMMVFTSIYGVVDGYFVSNFVGKTPFAAVNLVFPLLMILATAGFMFGTGGSAIVAKAFGEGRAKEANESFSLFVYIAAGLGVVLDAALVLSLPVEYKFIGAAVATAMSQVIGGLVPLIYFGRRNDSLLRLGKPKLRWKVLLKKSLILTGAMGIAMVGVGQLLTVPLAALFVGYDRELMDLTVSGFRIFVLSFPFMGYAIFGSGFFTAMNDGVTSAIISFLRTMVFQSASVLLLPLIWGIDGVWVSIIVAELMAMVFSGIFLVAKRKKYGYY